MSAVLMDTALPKTEFDAFSYEPDIETSRSTNRTQSHHTETLTERPPDCRGADLPKSLYAEKSM